MRRVQQLTIYNIGFSYYEENLIQSMNHKINYNSFQFFKINYNFAIKKNEKKHPSMFPALLYLNKYEIMLSKNV